jgi:EAL domain-containing protein (putative c-di-GMP-specific phosphodiesterase class I)
MKGLLKKYYMSHYKVEDFGRGKNNTSKKRHRGIIKSKANREFTKDINDNNL